MHLNSSILLAVVAGSPMGCGDRYIEMYTTNPRQCWMR